MARVLLLTLWFFATSGVAAPPAPVFVAVTAIVEHPSLNAVRDGLRAELERSGYQVGENLRFEYESAQGNAATAAQIARRLLGEAPDVIVPISTPSAQAVVAVVRDIPVVFTAVTDPLAARLVTNLERPGGNVSGMSDLPPLDKHLHLIRRLTPKARRVGVPYNPGEANSVAIVQRLELLGSPLGFEFVLAAAPRSADVQSAARSLVGKVDVIYVPTDNTVASALEGVVQVGEESAIPVYAADTDSVARGAVAALGFDYFGVGRQTARLVIRVLAGVSPGSIPVEGVQITELHVNPAAAKRMGLEIPEDVIAESAKVVR
jgi:putative ABC transport system substrate-binding protein